jgi:hypothetical protein
VHQCRARGARPCWSIEPQGFLFVHLPKTDIKKPATKAIKVN